MEGMLLALQPRVAVRRRWRLNPRLAVLLERKIKEGAMKKLERGWCGSRRARPSRGVAGDWGLERRAEDRHGDFAWRR